MRCRHRLAAIDKDFDEVFVDEDAQFHVFACWDCEGRLGAAHAECFVIRLEVDEQIFAVLTGKEE